MNLQECELLRKWEAMLYTQIQEMVKDLLEQNLYDTLTAQKQCLAFVALCSVEHTYKACIIMMAHVLITIFN